MWSKSDGKLILDIFNKLAKKELSKDANEILNILFLTNSYFPQRNISYLYSRNFIQKSTVIIL